MFRSLMSLCLFCAIGNCAFSQEVAIVLTGSLYDRELTEAESAEARERLDAARKSGDDSTFALESLRILDAKAKRLKQVRSTIILEVGKSVKCGTDSEDIIQAAHLEVFTLDDKSCELRASCAVGTLVGLSTDTHLVNLPRGSVKLNQLQVLGESGLQVVMNGKKQTYRTVQTMLVLPGKGHPLSSENISEHLTTELIKRMQIPRPGKLTSDQ